MSDLSNTYATEAPMKKEATINSCYQKWPSTRGSRWPGGAAAFQGNIWENCSWGQEWLWGSIFRTICVHMFPTYVSWDGSVERAWALHSNAEQRKIQEGMDDFCMWWGLCETETLFPWSMCNQVYKRIIGCFYCLFNLQKSCLTIKLYNDIYY